jgi:hypothetical protein
MISASLACRGHRHHRCRLSPPIKAVYIGVTLLPPAPIIVPAPASLVRVSNVLVSPTLRRRSRAARRSSPAISTEMLSWSVLPIQPLVPAVTILPPMVKTSLKINTSFLLLWMLPRTGGLPLLAPLTDSKKFGAGGKNGGDKKAVAHYKTDFADDTDRDAGYARLRDTSSQSG